MLVNWKVIRREHVVQACELIIAGKLGAGLRGRGLFVQFEGQNLPAKDVARVAYLIAVGQPADANLKFASGQSTLNMLTRLGFHVERRS